MRIKSIIINNLYRYGVGVSKVFDGDKTLISGINRDEPGCDSNGSGKSSIPNICAWVIFGNSFTENFQKEGVKEIIRRGCENGSAVLCMEDEKGNALEINRGTGKKKSQNFLKIKYNDKEIEGTTVSKGQEELLRLLNISTASKPKEIISDFLNTTYFSTSTVKGFIAKETTSKERFELIERFLGLKKYSQASSIAKEKKKEILSKIEADLEEITHKEQQLQETNIEGYEIKIEDCEMAISEKEEQLRELNTLLESESEKIQIKNKIQEIDINIINKKKNASNHYATLKSNYKQNQQIIVNLKNQIEAYEKERIELENLYKSVSENQSQISTLQKQVNNLNERVREITIQKERLNNEINNFSYQLSTKIKCPDCGSDLMYYDKKLHHIDLETLNKTIENHQSKIKVLIDEEIGVLKSQSEFNANIQTLQESFNSYQTKKAVLDSKETPEQIQTKILDLENKNKEIKINSDTFISEEKKGIKILEDSLKDFSEKLRSLTDTGVNPDKIRQAIGENKSEIMQLHNEIGQYQAQIKFVSDIESDIKRLRERTNAEKKRADEMGFWEIGFKEIKIQIIDEFLPAFEDEVNKNLEILKVGMQVDFNTRKKKANVSKKDIDNKTTTKEEFSVKILMGEDESPLNVMSQGERGRVGMCVGFGLRTLTSEKGNNIFDFLFIDEIADSLDSTGLMELINLLDGVGGQKFVISHNEELKNYFDNTITAVRENGVSTIE